MWLPLWLDGAPTGALLRVQMQAEWFGALKALTPAEETAVVLLQRALRRFRERRRRAEELRSLSFGLFSTQAEAAVSVLRAANVPRKAGYFVLVQALGPPQGARVGCGLRGGGCYRVAFWVALRGQAAALPAPGASIS